MKLLRLMALYLRTLDKEDYEEWYTDKKSHAHRELFKFFKWLVESGNLSNLK